MTKFAIGEVAVMCNATIFKHLNGVECTITGILDTYQMTRLNGLLAYGYPVETHDGHIYVCKPHQLRKRRPPSTDESESRQAMLDCIERAKRGCEVPA